MTSNDKREYREDLDGFRGLAAIFVLVSHFFPDILPNGIVGLDIFFVLSGYLISFLVLKRIHAGNFNPFSFWLNRAKRIFVPSFITIICITILAKYLLFPNEWLDYRVFLRSSLGFFTNIALIRGSGYFSPLTIRRPLMHFWSLSVEEQFYFIFPVLLIISFYIIKKIEKRITIKKEFLWGSLFSTIAVLSLVYFFYTDKYYLSLRSRLWEMFLGASLALFVPFTVKREVKKRDEVFLATSFVLMFLSLFVIKEQRIVIVLGAFSAFAFIAAHPLARLKRIFFAKPLVGLGLISYSLYLWHWSLLSMSKIVFAHLSSFDVFIIMFIVIIISSLSYIFIERPLKKIRFSFTKENFSRNRNVYILVSLVIISQLSLFLMTPYLKARPKISKTYKGESIKLPIVFDEDMGFERVCTLDKRDPHLQYCLIHEKNKGISSERNLVMGDSHAHSIITAWPNHAPQMGMWNLYSIGGCPPFFVNSSDYTCQKEFQVLMKRIEKGEFKFKRAFLVMANRTFNLLEKELNSNFEDIVQELKFFLAHVEHVYIIEGVPEIAESIESCLYNRFSFETKLNHVYPCKIDRKIWDENYEKQHLFYVKLKKRLPQLKILNPAPVICDNEACKAIHGQYSWYYDKDHLAFHGSEAAVKLLTPLVFKAENRALK